MAIEKYTTKCIVLEGYEKGEHDKVFKLFTRDFGLIMAHAKSVRKLESKLRAHVMPGKMATVTLVKGKEVWRLVGAEEKAGKYALLKEAVHYLGRFVRGEGTYKSLYDRIVLLLDKCENLEEGKVRLLLLYMLLVGLGYADAKVIGAKTIEEYVMWSIDDLYTHLILTHKEVRSHVFLVMKEMQL